MVHTTGVIGTYYLWRIEIGGFPLEGNVDGARFAGVAWMEKEPSAGKGGNLQCSLGWEYESLHEAR